MEDQGAPPSRLEASARGQSPEGQRAGAARAHQGEVAQPDATLIIATWNSAAVIGECLRSIRRTVTGSSYEIIVVDNASIDHTLDVVKQFSADENLVVRVVPLDRNVGYGEALNVGASKANAPLLLMLNPDVIFENDVVTVLKGALAQYPTAAIAGPLVLDPQRRPVASAWRWLPSPGSVLLEYARLSGMAKRLGVRALSVYVSPNSASQARVVGCIAGCCIAVAKDHFLRASGFDPKMFLYSEEFDFCRRVVMATGKAVIYVPQARMVHLGGTSSKQVPSPDIAKLALSSLFYYLAKHYSTRAALGTFYVLKVLSRLYLGIAKLADRLFALSEQQRQRQVEYEVLARLSYEDITRMIEPQPLGPRQGRSNCRLGGGL